MTVVYDAGWQGKKVRALTWFLLATGVLLCWLGTLRPQVPPAEPESPAALLFATLLAFGAGIAIPAAMLVYGRCYVGRVEIDDGDGAVHLHTVGLIGSPRHVFRPEDFASGAYHHGRMDTYKHRVNAPWFTLRVPGRRLPFILDPQGDVIDAERAEETLGLEPGSLSPWEVDRPLAPPASTRTPKERDRHARNRDR